MLRNIFFPESVSVGFSLSRLTARVEMSVPPADLCGRRAVEIEQKNAQSRRYSAAERASRHTVGIEQNVATQLGHTVGIGVRASDQELARA